MQLRHRAWYGLLLSSLPLLSSLLPSLLLSSLLLLPLLLHLMMLVGGLFTDGEAIAHSFVFTFGTAVLFVLSKGNLPAVAEAMAVSSTGSDSHSTESSPSCSLFAVV